MAMDELVSYIVKGLVDNPGEVSVRMVEGEATIMLELSVNPDDVPLVKGEDSQTLHYVRAVLSAASGRRKAILELLGDAEAGAEE